MRHKDKTISIRLNDQQYAILESNSKNLNMSISEYIRSQIDNAPTVVPNHRQEVSSIMCRLYILLEEQGLGDEAVVKEVHQLCQM